MVEQKKQNSENDFLKLNLDSTIKKLIREGIIYIVFCIDNFINFKNLRNHKFFRLYRKNKFIWIQTDKNHNNHK